MNTNSVYLGVLLLEISVVLIALGANIQRFALSRIAPERRLCVPWLSFRTSVWLGGLTIYFGANVIYTVALVFAPASLCATLVSTIILANAIMSRWLLKERLELVDLQGGLLITAGIAVAAWAAPYQAEAYNAVELYDLLSAPRSLYALGFTLLLLVCVAAVVIAHEDEGAGIAAEPYSPKGSAKRPLQWRQAAMPFAYPVVVGLIEALVQIAQKGGASMLALTLSGESQLGHATLYVVVGWWAGASLMTVWWLRKALHALEASRVLPIEYGTFTATSVLLGLIVYDEAKWVSTTNRWLMAIGISIIVGGCALVGGRRPIRISSLTPQQQALSETLL